MGKFFKVVLVFLVCAPTGLASAQMQDNGIDLRSSDRISAIGENVATAPVNPENYPVFYAVVRGLTPLFGA